MKKVLITNGENLRALIFIRALAGKNDIELHVSAERRFAAGLYSKYCKHKTLNVNPKKDSELFIQQMLDYVKKNNIDVFIPVNADEIDVVLKNRKLFPKNVVIPFVDYQKFTYVKDKWNFYNLMKSLKIPTPKTATKFSEEFTFPLILKIRNGAGSKGVQKVNNKQELAEATVNISKEYKEYPLVQEYIENGENYCAAAFCKKGKVESVFVYKSLRQYPIDHGTSTSKISVKDAEIEKYVRKILLKLKWNGVAQFDMIKKDDKVYFLEMNPRLYTSLNLTVQSGLNYPYYLCVDSDIPKEYKVGVICRIILSDTLVFFKSVFRKKNYSLKEFFKRHHNDDLLWSDPKPSIPLFVKFIRGKLL